MGNKDHMKWGIHEENLLDTLQTKNPKNVWMDKMNWQYRDYILYIYLKSTCDVNLLSKLAIIFKEWRVIVLFVL